MDAMKTTLLLVRHGESEANAAGIVQGSADGPLSPEGRAQAAALAARLRTTKFDVLVTSDQRRAVETAEMVNVGHNAPLVRISELRERSKGAWEGIPKKEFSVRHPEVIAAWQRDEDVRPPGGENFEDVAARVIPKIDALIVEYRGKAILHVGHGNVIRVILGHFLGTPLNLRYKFAQDHCAVSIITIADDGRATLACMNDAAHLPSRS